MGHDTNSLKGRRGSEPWYIMHVLSAIKNSTQNCWMASKWRSHEVHRKDTQKAGSEAALGWRGFSGEGTEEMFCPHQKIHMHAGEGQVWLVRAWPEGERFSGRGWLRVLGKKGHVEEVSLLCSHVEPYTLGKQAETKCSLCCRGTAMPAAHGAVRRNLWKPYSPGSIGWAGLGPAHHQEPQMRCLCGDCDAVMGCPCECKIQSKRAWHSNPDLARSPLVAWSWVTTVTSPASVCPPVNRDDKGDAGLGKAKTNETELCRAGTCLYVKHWYFVHNGFSH